MWKKGLLLFLVMNVLAFQVPSTVSAGVQPVEAGRTVRPLPDGLQVSWQTPSIRLRQQPDGAFVVGLDGFASGQTPGQPALPEDAMLIALPPDATPALEFQLDEGETVALPGPVARVPATLTVPVAGQEQVFDLSQPAETDTAAVTLEEIGVMRGVRLARLRFRPVRLVDGALVVIPQAAATVHYGSASQAGDPISAQAISSNPFLAGLAGQVANPEQMAVSSAAGPATLGLTDRTGQVAVEVSRTGLTAITRAELSAAGFPVGSVDPHRLHLERAGAEIPTEWDGDEDTAFEPGEQMLFYAQPRFSRWTAEDVYFLSVSPSASQAMLERTLSPAGKPAASLWIDPLFEQNAIYTPDCYCAPVPAGRDGDRWVWELLRKPDRTSATYAFSVAAVDESQAAQITLWLIGYTAVPHTSHTVQVRLNGNLLGEQTFSGKNASEATLSIPAGVLKAGSNNLALTLVDNGELVDGVWLDAFSVHAARDLSPLAAQVTASGASVASQYAIAVPSTAGLRAYDVTDPDAPVRLMGAAVDATHALLADPAGSLPAQYAVVPAGTLLAPDRVRMANPLKTTQGADFVLISPPDFIPDLADLVSLRQSQGLNVAVEDVRAIYDAADGRPTPQAIRAYLANAYSHWTPRPAYVILVGDGTTDPRQYRSGSSATWIPPYLADVDPVIGEIAADNRYAMLDGSDNLPDLAIGRLPVNSHVEAAITLTKIVQYARRPVSGEWSRSMLMVSDKRDPSVGDFAAENAALAAGYADSRYGITQLGNDEISSPAAVHQAVLDQWNQGYGLMLYNGHGSTQQWGADVLLHVNDLPALTNGRRLPVLFEMTCLTGSFQLPDLPTLDETLLRRSGKGVAAAWGSTGLGLSNGSMMLAQGALDQIMSDPGIRLGVAINRSKLSLETTAPALAYLADTFTLLGDPAMQVGYFHDTFLPAIQSVKP